MSTIHGTPNRSSHLLLTRHRDGPAARELLPVAAQLVGVVPAQADRDAGPNVSGGKSDNLMRMKDISATEAARRFSDLLDAVEHRHETFRVTRGGRAVARIAPVEVASGRAVKDLLARGAADAGWASDLAELRSMLVTEERDWTG
jgi:prevent-host-death family protein